MQASSNINIQMIYILLTIPRKGRIKHDSRDGRKHDLNICGHFYICFSRLSFRKKQTTKKQKNKWYLLNRINFVKLFWETCSRQLTACHYLVVCFSVQGQQYWLQNMLDTPRMVTHAPIFNNHSHYLTTPSSVLFLTVTFIHLITTLLNVCELLFEIQNHQEFKSAVENKLKSLEPICIQMIFSGIAPSLSSLHASLVCRLDHSTESISLLIRFQPYSLTGLPSVTSVISSKLSKSTGQLYTDPSVEPENTVGRSLSQNPLCVGEETIYAVPCNIPVKKEDSTAKPAAEYENTRLFTRANRRGK